MQPGSVIVDLAAEQGGNCALTERDRVVREVRREDRRLHGPAEPDGPPVERSVRDDGLQPGRGRLQVQGRQAVARPGPRGRGASRGPSSLQDGKVLWPPPTRPKPRSAAPPPEAKPHSRARLPPSSRRVGSRPCSERSARWPCSRPASSRAAEFVRAPDRVPAGLRRRLARRLEREPRAAHAAHERHQRHQRDHPRRRRSS